MRRREKALADRDTAAVLGVPLQRDDAARTYGVQPVLPRQITPTRRTGADEPFTPAGHDGDPPTRWRRGSVDRPLTSPRAQGATGPDGSVRRGAAQVGPSSRRAPIRPG